VSANMPEPFMLPMPKRSQYEQRETTGTCFVLEISPQWTVARAGITITITMGHFHELLRKMTQCMPTDAMSACFSSIAEFFNVIIPFSCVALRCGDKRQERKQTRLLFTASNFDPVPGHDMTLCRNPM